jgi:hypothetical protein
MGVSGQHHAPAALYPWERNPRIHCTGGWVGPRAGLDTEARGKILCPCRGSNPDRPVIQVQVQVQVLLNNTPKPNVVQRSTRLKLYKTLALPILLYGSEILTIKQCNKNRFLTAEMKSFWRRARYTLLKHKRNEDILEEIHVTPLEDKLCTYRHKWF